MTSISPSSSTSLSAASSSAMSAGPSIAISSAASRAMSAASSTRTSLEFIFYTGGTGKSRNRANKAGTLPSVIQIPVSFLSSNNRLFSNLNCSHLDIPDEALISVLAKISQKETRDRSPNEQRLFELFLKVEISLTDCDATTSRLKALQKAKEKTSAEKELLEAFSPITGSHRHADLRLALMNFKDSINLNDTSASERLNAIYQQLDTHVHGLAKERWKRMVKEKVAQLGASLSSSPKNWHLFHKDRIRDLLVACPSFKGSRKDQVSQFQLLKPIQSSFQNKCIAKEKAFFNELYLSATLLEPLRVPCNLPIPHPDEILKIQSTLPDIKGD